MPEFFTIRIYKNRGGAGTGKEYSNEYAFEYPDGTTVSSPEPLLDLNKLVGFEKRFATSNIFYNRGVISTLAPDDANPNLASKTVGLAGRGTKEVPPGQATLPHEFVLPLNIGGDGGRSGRKEYRGFLLDSDVTGLSGTYQLKSGVMQDISNQLLNFVTENPQTIARMRLVSRYRGVTSVRGVATFTFGDILFQKGTVNRRPKVSLDQDAINRRLENLIKELLFLSASIGAARALGNITRQQELGSLIGRIRAAADGIPEA
jgi:hypothetical protein